MNNLHIISIKKTLIDLGLEAREADIYLATLKIGSGTIMEISRAGYIERTGIYYHLDRLIELGLLKMVNKGKRTVYLPTDPIKLKRLLQKKEKNLNQILPKLEKIFTKSAGKSVVSYYQGEEGLITLYEQLYKIASKLAKENNYYIFGHSFDAYDALPDFFPKYIEKRSKLSVTTKIILPIDEKPSYKILNQTNNPEIIAKYNLHVPERRYLNREYGFRGTTFILDKYVASMDFENYFGTLIENQNLAQTWRVFFEFIWNHLPNK